MLKAEVATLRQVIGSCIQESMLMVDEKLTMFQ